MQFGNQLHKKLSPSIPLGTVLSQGDKGDYDHITESNLERSSIEIAWLNVPVGMKEESWNFTNPIGFLPQKLLCLHRWKVWWMIPRLIHDTRQEGVVPAETTLVLGKLSENQYLLLIPAVDQNTVFSLEGSISINSHTNSTSPPVLVLHGFDNSHGPITINTNSNDTDTINMRKGLLIATGPDPFELIRVAVNMMKTHVRESNKHTIVTKDDDGDNEIVPNEIESKLTVSTENENNSFNKPTPSSNSQNNNSNNDNKKKKIVHRLSRGAGPSFVDYFGWCTWDSFYTDLSTSRVLKGLDSFTRLGVTPRFLILDDGWQSTDVDDKMNGEQWSGRLRSFQANYKFHPQFKHNDDDDYDDKQVIDNIMTITESATTTTASGTTTTVSQTTTVFEREGVTTSLKDIIDTVKNSHHIKYFLVWHSLLGYWAGVEPHTTGENDEKNTSQNSTNTPSNVDSSTSGNMSGSDRMGVGNMFRSKLTYANYGSPMLRMTNPAALYTEPASTIGVGLVDRNKAAAFYNAYHAALKEMGVDGVKVDAQSILPSLRDEKGGGWELTKTFHDGLQNSVSNHFGGGSSSGGMKDDFDSESSSSSGSSNSRSSKSKSKNKKMMKVEKTLAANEISLDGSSSEIELKASIQQSSASSSSSSSSSFPATSVSANNNEMIDTKVITSNTITDTMDDVLIEHPIIHCMCHSRETIWSVAALYPNIHELDEQEEEVEEEGNDNNNTNGNDVIGKHVSDKEKVYRLNLQQPVFRGSDDFWPKDPASHGPHIFSNALNSLLLNHVGLQDWDAFQSVLPNRAAAKLHAVSRAVSGGPVYTSDRKDTHDVDIITRLSLREGRVPRCLRGALPVERLLFHDPQRVVGVPLMLQNKNPAGGYVIAAFNILGAVLEEDLNMFRFLAVEEIDWRGRDKSNNNKDNTGIDETKSCITHPNDDVNDDDDDDDIESPIHMTKDQPISFPRQRYATQPPVYENEKYINKTFIRHYASLNDISEWKKSQQKIQNPITSSRRDYLARRFSDGALFYLSDTTTTTTAISSDNHHHHHHHHRVPFELSRVFDFEIITFSPIHRLSLPLSDYSSASSSGGQWVTATGMTHMYNSGGSVMKIKILPYPLPKHAAAAADDDDDDIAATAKTATTVNSLDTSNMLVRLHVLGSGTYSLITTQSNASIISCQPQYSHTDISTTTTTTATTDKVTCHVLSIQPVSIQHMSMSSTSDAIVDTNAISTYEIKLQVSLPVQENKQNISISSLNNNDDDDDDDIEGVVIEVLLTNI